MIQSQTKEEGSDGMRARLGDSTEKKEKKGCEMHGRFSWSFPSSFLSSCVHGLGRLLFSGLWAVHYIRRSLSGLVLFPLSDLITRSTTAGSTCDDGIETHSVKTKGRERTHGIHDVQQCDAPWDVGGRVGRGRDGVRHGDGQEAGEDAPVFLFVFFQIGLDVHRLNQSSMSRRPRQNPRTARRQPRPSRSRARPPAPGGGLRCSGPARGARA